MSIAAICNAACRKIICFPRSRLAAAALVAVSVLPLRAQSVPVKPTLPQVVTYALRFNPDLNVARLRIDSAHGEQRIARALPNPTFTTIPGNPFQYSLTQPVDLVPARYYRTRAAGQGKAATRLDVDDVQRQVVFNVRQSYFDLLLADALRSIAGEKRDIMHQLLLTDSLRFKHGDLAQKDVSTTELGWAHADAAFARSETVVRATRINLQVLMGVVNPDTAFRVSGALKYQDVEIPFDSLRAMALARRPDVVAARQRVDQSRSLRRLAIAALFPTPGVSAVYQQTAPPAPDGTPSPPPFQNGSNYALGLSFNVPILYWFTGERQRASAGVNAAQIASRRVEVQAQSDVTVASNNFRASKMLAEKYAGGLLDRARAALEMQRFAYEHGNASLLDVLNTISAFGDIQTDYYTALHDFWVSAYAIDQAVGRDIVQ